VVPFKLMEDDKAAEPLVLLSTFQKELSGLESTYQTYLQALADSGIEGASSTLQHVILLESATEDLSVRSAVGSTIEPATDSKLHIL